MEEIQGRDREPQTASTPEYRSHLGLPSPPPTTTTQPECSRGSGSPEVRGGRRQRKDTSILRPLRSRGAPAPLRAPSPRPRELESGDGLRWQRGVSSPAHRGLFLPRRPPKIGNAPAAAPGRSAPARSPPRLPPWLYASARGRFPCACPARGNEHVVRAGRGLGERRGAEVAGGEGAGSSLTPRPGVARATWKAPFALFSREPGQARAAAEFTDSWLGRVLARFAEWLVDRPSWPVLLRDSLVFLGAFRPADYLLSIRRRICKIWGAASYVKSYGDPPQRFQEALD